MDLLLSDEQQALQDSFQRGVIKELPMDRFHGASRAPEDGSASKTFAELGWLRISLAEALGGLGMGHAEEVLLFRELGRNLGPVSMMAGVLAARVAATAGDTERAEAILDGETDVGLIVAERDDAPSDAPDRFARLFTSAPCSTAVMVRADHAVLVELPDPGPALPCLDETLTMHRVDLRRAREIARIDGPDLWLHGLLLTAATLVGQAESARDMILEYAKVRHTFGRPIGAYQAVRHPIAEMTARCEHARCLTYYAALALDMGRDDAAMQVAAARVVAQEAAARNADGNIQLHGAVGITDELRAHLFMKKSVMLSNLFAGKKPALRRVLDQALMEV
ncbi:acyl-CoA dehydrogenase family protein [Sphingomonas sp. MG17]|jgi:alkylation response protein AidB-like acyl-CoA dehydrogenase|uniref:Acyl-CoA dehydrogenase family protein n=1 Tax=Sphingomonas tagetis TaxID=2949092 RepID=A0A9X2HKX5_9SPHN|nr:acyl-CoA dehydrogenase [Sphingomonas tagetis]MCP3732803.1 acyl-CoA dehydrogenase family protein [Sphingomonas tagetis]